MNRQPTPETTPYELIGGEATVRKLVDRFYELMDEDWMRNKQESLS